MQAAGDLRVVRAEGAAPLPPFERWSFREERYIQWLADMQAAHLTLEAAVADAITVAATEHYGARPCAWVLGCESGTSGPRHLTPEAAVTDATSVGQYTKHYGACYRCKGAK